MTQRLKRPPSAVAVPSRERSGHGQGVGWIPVLISVELPSLKLTANAPKIGWLEYDPFLLGRPLFRGYVSFREGDHLSFLFVGVFFLNRPASWGICIMLAIKTLFSVFGYVFSLQPENWNNNFLKFERSVWGSNTCIFDEFRVFWDTFAAKGCRMVLWFKPSKTSKRSPKVWLVYNITQIYRDAAKILPKIIYILHPTATLLIPYPDSL